MGRLRFLIVVSLIITSASTSTSTNTSPSPSAGARASASVSASASAIAIAFMIAMGVVSIISGVVGYSFCSYDEYSCLSSLSS